MRSKCVIIAGEMSADILGSEIISNNQEIDWFGVGGPLMRANNLTNIIYDYLGSDEQDNNIQFNPYFPSMRRLASLSIKWDFID